MTRYAIGVDIGASRIKLALIDADGNLLGHDTVFTPHAPTPERVTDGIIRITRDFQQSVAARGFASQGIGFAVPHFFEGPRWEQRQTNNMPGLEGFAMYPPLCAAFGPSIAMANDLSAAGVAEHMFGRGRDSKRMLFMAIGTGISTSAVTEDGLLQYNWASMGDTGQIIVDTENFTPCTCGAKGCVEAVAAAPALRREALKAVAEGRSPALAERRAAKGDLEARDVSEAAQEGDAAAREILSRAGYFLGLALSSYLHIFRPDLIVLGGGVAQAGELLLTPIRETMARVASPYYLARLKGIEVSALGNLAAAIGCAALILYPGRYIRSAVRDLTSPADGESH